MRDYVIVAADKQPSPFNLFELLGLIITASSEEQAKDRAKQRGISQPHVVTSRPSFRTGNFSIKH